MADLVVSVDVDAPAGRAFERLLDWEAQGEWMVATRVRADGDQVEAVTGVGPLAVRDSMVVTQRVLPAGGSAGRCLVRHTGRLIRGTGAFEVQPLGPARSRVVWSEWFVLPMGLVGQVGWLAVRPLLRAGLALSLRRFANLVAGEDPAVPT